MTKTILTFFTNSGAPATGLSATIRIRTVSDNALVITDAAMTEVGDGFYKYDFTTYDENLDYSIRCDGSATLSNSDRYSFAGNESYVEDIWDAQTTDHQVVGSLALEIRAAHSDSGSLASGGRVFTKEEAEALAKMVWEVILQGEEKAKDVLLSRSVFDALKDKVKVGEMPEMKDADLAPVLKAISSIVSEMVKVKQAVLKIDIKPQVTVEPKVNVIVPDSVVSSLKDIKSYVTELNSLLSNAPETIVTSVSSLSDQISKLEELLAESKIEQVDGSFDKILVATDALSKTVARLDSADGNFRGMLKGAMMYNVMSNKR